MKISVLEARLSLKAIATEAQNQGLQLHKVGGAIAGSHAGMFVTIMARGSWTVAHPTSGRVETGDLGNDLRAGIKLLIGTADAVARNAVIGVGKMSPTERAVIAIFNAVRSSFGGSYEKGVADDYPIDFDGDPLTTTYNWGGRSNGYGLSNLTVYIHDDGSVSGFASSDQVSEAYERMSVATLEHRLRTDWDF